MTTTAACIADSEVKLDVSSCYLINEDEVAHTTADAPRTKAKAGK